MYDLWGRRIAKLLDTDADSDYDEETHYLLDGERYERGHAGDHIVLTFDANGDLTNRYLYGPAVDQILADEQTDDVLGTTVIGEVLWPLTDHLGTVRDIADFDSMTDTTTVVNHITYGVYGVITAETNSTIEHAVTFTGRERDYESGILHYRARYYFAATGVFLSEDPLGFAAADMNLSRYVGNQVTYRVDPSGLDFTIIYNSPHMGIEFDVWDDQGNHLGVMSVDFGAYGWRNNESMLSWSFDDSSASSSSLCNSHRSWSSWGGHFNSGEFIIGFKPNGTLKPADGETVIKQKGPIKADKKMFEYIAKSVGMTADELMAALESGQMSFTGRGRWYAYEVFTNSCRSFANSTWYRYSDNGGYEIPPER